MQPGDTTNMGNVLARRALRNPEKEAVVDTTTGKRLTYRELHERANQAANTFVAWDIQKGDRVALLLPNSIEFMECFYGCATIGAVVVLLNWRLVADELEFLLQDSGAETLVFGQEYAAIAAELATRNSTRVTRWVQVDSDVASSNIDSDRVAASRVASNDVDSNDVASDRVESNHAASNHVESYHSALAAHPASMPPVQASGDDTLCLCYSSGTTGRPKGAMLTHEGQLWAVFSNLGSSEDFNLFGNYLLVMPMFHLGGLLPMEVAVFAGSTVVIMKSFDAERVWEVIRNERVTSGLVVPAMLNALLNVYSADRHDHRSLRNLWCAAAPLPITLIEQCMTKGIGLLQTYGLTECGGPGTILGKEDATRKVGSSGRPYLLTEVQIVRPDRSRCDPEEAGELLVRGKHVMKGYWNNPDATAVALEPDGWLHTGDVAVMDAEGFVTIQDRIKDMIISGGENIYPAEIENVILSHELVREVAVVAQPSTRWGESPLAVVVRNPPTSSESASESVSRSLSEADVLDWCTGKLARYKLPKAVVFVDEIPRNASGKALKRILRERFPGPAPE